MYTSTYYLLLFIFLPLSSISCPTCVGRLKPESPPFFHKEFHQEGHKKAVSKEEYAQVQFKKLLQKTQDKK